MNHSSYIYLIFFSLKNSGILLSFKFNVGLKKKRNEHKLLLLKSVDSISSNFIL